MKKPSILCLLPLLLIQIGTLYSQTSSFRTPDSVSHHAAPVWITPPESARIKDIQSFDTESGLAYTSSSLFRTDDGGNTWREISLPRSKFRGISSVSFENENIGFMVLVDMGRMQIELARTVDGGSIWTTSPITLQTPDLAEADLEHSSIVSSGDGSLMLEFRLSTSSNFSGSIKYESRDNGESWELVGRSVSFRTSDIAVEKRSGPWRLTTNGACDGFKSNCFQETKIFVGGTEITPHQVKSIAKTEREHARKIVPTTPMFALPPGGSTRISLNRGFDKCTAAPASQMQLWWDNSPFYDANIYMSGRNRACAQPQLTAAWVDQVSGMGWGLIPTIVGFQSPCTSSATTQKFSLDPAVAENQGRGEADIAVADANNLGLSAGTILYYDMERYDETAATPGCRTASTAFLKGWTDRLKSLGYKSGTYGSPKNAQEDWINLPSASRIDAVWLARWDNVPSVWTYVSFPGFPTNVWNNHQRIKQWQAPHNETWGGVTFNIDGNISDGPVAGTPIPKNKNADFDGDGKTDLSVFRPSSGQWFISGSLGPTFSYYNFGEAADILTPGDFDGDGKTDFAVFRPGSATWYFRFKGGSFGARQFGAAGDIPAAADYNGDGKCDIALFRPSTGTWYIAYSDSLNTFSAIQFGVAGDKPVPADYDGDGKTDIAVWRPSDGVWHVFGSAGNYFTATWGVPDDLPAQGDYDGDGKADFAIYRNGTWYLLQTTAGIRVQQFGVAGDVPATGDFDGDGRDDVAVFRPSNGNWYLSQSQNGFSVREFGVSNDKPVPTAYLPR